MTFTQDSELEIASLSVVLRSSTFPRQLLPLTQWLTEFDPIPTWVPLGRSNGATRVMAVLPQPQPYPDLMQSLCRRIGQRSTVEWQGRPYDLTGVEVNSHALHVLQIPITATEPLPPTLGRAIHALCFRWLGAADAALAERLHQQETFPITLSMRSMSAKQMLLRVGLLQKELLAPLLWGLSQDLGAEMSITDVPCRIGQKIEILQSNTYEALAELPPQRVIDLQFLTPTSFKQAQQIQPFPLPELVFSSLLRRWNAFAPIALQFPKQEWQGVTAAFDLKTYALKMKGEPRLGNQGWARYEFANEEQAQIATTLAHFAYFAGVGRKTAMGMGQTKILIESR